MALPKANIRWNEILDWLSGRAGSGGTGSQDNERRWVAIVVSAMIAFVLWFTFNMREVYTVVIEMPAIITNLPDEQALEGLPPSTARVHVQGGGWRLLQLYYNPQRLYVDASDGEEIDLLESAALLNLPSGVIVQSVSPRTINLRTARRAGRTVPIEVRARIEPPPTYDLVGELDVTPDSVTIMGAESLIQQIDIWPTRDVRFTDLRGAFSVSVPLSDTLARLVQRDVQEVTISGHMDVFTEGTRLIDVTLVGGPPGVHMVALYPQQVRVTYRLPLSQFEQAQIAEDFVATVSYSDILNDTTGSVVPEIEVPQNLTMRDVRYEPRRLGYYMLVD